MKNLGKFLLQKDAHAIAVALVCALLPLFYLPVGFIAAIIVGLVTLQKGAKSGFWVLAWVALPAVATLVLRHVGMFDVLLLRCLLVWALASVLRRFQSWGLVLEIAAFTGVIVIVLLHVAFPDLQQWWLAKLTEYITEVSKASEWKLALTPADYAQRVAPFATGLVSFLFLTGVTLELLIAHFWQTIVSGSNNFRVMFAQIRIGRFAAGISLVLLAISLLKINFVMDALPIIVLPFFIAGLSLVHFFVQAKKTMIAVLVVIYIALVFIPLIVVSGLAVIGLLDAWIDFRQKIEGRVSV